MYMYNMFNSFINLLIYFYLSSYSLIFCFLSIFIHFSDSHDSMSSDIESDRENQTEALLVEAAAFVEQR